MMARHAVKLNFSQYFVANITSEWQNHYVQYERLRTLIKHRFERERGRDLSAVSNQRFFSLCQQELTKVSLFFGHKMAECRKNFHDLDHEFRNWQRENSGSSSFVRNHPLKTGLSEFYFQVTLVKRYQQLNLDAFKHLMDKHDKLFGNDNGDRWGRTHVLKSSVGISLEADALLDKTSARVIQLENNDADAAKRLLRVPVREETHLWTTFRLGLFTGSLLALTFCVLKSVANLDGRMFTLAVLLFRAPLIAYISVALFGICVHFCQSAGINHVLIFDIDPRNHLKFERIGEIGAFLLVTWMICVLGFCHSDMIGCQPTDFALAQVFLVFVWLFNPFDFLCRNSRYWFLLHMAQSMMAPLFKPSFVNFWLSKQFASLPVVFADMCLVYCNLYARFTPLFVAHNSTQSEAETIVSGIERCAAELYAVRAFLSLIPSIMCMQTFLREFVAIGTDTEHPALTGAAKYSLFIVLVIFRMLQIFSLDELGPCSDNPFCYFWVVSCILALVYASWWDMSVDWGLQLSSKEWLRSQLVFGRRIYYYLGIGSNLVLRINWLFYLSNCWAPNSELLVAAAAILECFRRFSWNMFSLEFQHVNNRAQLKAARVLNFKKKRYQFANVENLLAKIDKEDGVIHRKMGQKAKQKEEPLQKIKRQLSGIFLASKYQEDQF